MDGTVFNIQKFCLHDGDGIRTTVFLKGCPLRCIWCHNPESKGRKPQLMFNKARCTGCGRCICDARSIDCGVVTIDRAKCTVCGGCVEKCLNNANEICGKTMSADEVMKEVLKDKMFYGENGGLTVSGGEPSFQPEFTLELLSMAKENNIGRAMETCGIGDRTFYKRAKELGTTFLFDLKCADDKKHKRLTGVDPNPIYKNLEYLLDEHADVILRLPLIPGCNDSEVDIASMGLLIHCFPQTYRSIEIMPYHKLGVGKSERVGAAAEYEHENATAEDKQRWLDLFKKYGYDNIRISE